MRAILSTRAHFSKHARTIKFPSYRDKAIIKFTPMGSSRRDLNLVEESFLSVACFETTFDRIRNDSLVFDVWLQSHCFDCAQI